MEFQLSIKEIKAFQHKILTWYKIHQRDLPWRKNRDPYRILVSEIMLQQTQVNRVIPKYEAWLERFPTIQDLVKAPTRDVLHYWSGLGYNRRALYLKKAAEMVVKEYGGEFPQNEKKLLKLPGIGEYTARAILCFAFDKQIAVVDTNIRRVILTQFQISNSKLSRRAGSRFAGQISNNKEIQEIADQLLPHGKVYEWNQALMDYSSEMLREHKIPIPKQSKFLGSHRYYRGQIIKTLLQKKKVKIEDLGKIIKKDYTKADKEWLNKLLAEMVNEGFIIRKNEKVSLY